MNLAVYSDEIVAYCIEALQQAAATSAPIVWDNYELAHAVAHMIHCERWGDVNQLLTSLTFIEAKCSSSMAYQLIDDYTLGLSKTPIDEMTAIVKAFAEVATLEVPHLEERPGLAFPLLYYHLVSSNDPGIQAVLDRERRIFEAKGRPWLKIRQKPGLKPISILSEHTALVAYAAVSPDGKIAVSVSLDGELKAFRFPSGEPLWKTKVTVEVTNNSGYLWVGQEYERILKPAYPKALSISGDGQKVFLHTTDDEYVHPLGSVNEYEHLTKHLASSRNSEHYPSEEEMNEYADLTSRGALIDSTIWFDILTGEKIGSLRKQRSKDRKWTSKYLHPTPDGERILDGNSIFGTGDASEITVESKRLGSLQNVLAYDGVIAVSYNQSSIELWNIRSGKHLAKVQWNNSYQPNRIEISPNRSWYAIQASDSEIEIHEIPSGTRLAQINTGANSLVTWMVSPNGSNIITRSGEHIIIWDGITGSSLRQIETSTFDHFKIIGQGHFLILSDSSAVDDALCDIQTGRVFSTPQLLPFLGKWTFTDPNTGVPGRIHELILRADEPRKLIVSTGHRTELWDLDAVINSDSGGSNDGAIAQFALASQGGGLITATTTGKVDFCCFESEGMKKRTLADSEKIQAVAISTDSAYGCWINENGMVHIVDCNSSQIKSQFQVKIQHVAGCRFISNNTELLIWSDYTAGIWNIRKRRCRFFLDKGNYKIGNGPIYFSPFFIMVKHSKITIYHTGLRLPIRTLETDNEITNVSFDPLHGILCTLHEEYKRSSTFNLKQEPAENLGSRIWELTLGAQILGAVFSKAVSFFAMMAGASLPKRWGEFVSDGPLCEKCVVSKDKLICYVPQGIPGLYITSLGKWTSDFRNAKQELLAPVRALSDLTLSSDNNNVAWCERTGRLGVGYLVDQATVDIFAPLPLNHCQIDTQGKYVAALDNYSFMYVFEAR